MYVTNDNENDWEKLYVPRILQSFLSARQILLNRNFTFIILC
mgnify:FL=1